MDVRKLLSEFSQEYYLPPHKLDALVKEFSGLGAYDDFEQRLYFLNNRKRIIGYLNRMTQDNIRVTAIRLLKQCNLERWNGILPELLTVMVVQSDKLVSSVSILSATINTVLPGVIRLFCARCIGSFLESLNEKSTTRQRRNLLATIGKLISLGVLSTRVGIDLLEMLVKSSDPTHAELGIFFLPLVYPWANQEYPDRVDECFERLRRIRYQTKNTRLKYLIEGITELRATKVWTTDPDTGKVERICSSSVPQTTHDFDVSSPDAFDEDNYGDAVYTYDENFLENEEGYRKRISVILGAGSGKREKEARDVPHPIESVQDLKRTAYIPIEKKVFFSIMNSISEDEALHKIEVIRREERKKGNEKIEEQIAKAVVEMASRQKKKYSDFPAKVANLLSLSRREYRIIFETIFLETHLNVIPEFPEKKIYRIRNLGTFFAELFFSRNSTLNRRVLFHLKLTLDPRDAQKRIFIESFFSRLGELRTKSELMEIVYGKDTKPAKEYRGIFVSDDDETEEAEYRKIFLYEFFKYLNLKFLVKNYKNQIKD